MRTDGRKISREVLEAYRLRAMKLRENGYSVREISNIFALNYHSVSHWFCRKKKHGIKSLRRTFAPGAECKLQKEVLLWIKRTLKNPATNYGFAVPLWNSRMLVGLLSQEKKINLDSSTVWRYLCRMGLSFQKPQRRYKEQDKQKAKKWIMEEWPKVQEWVRKRKAILYFEDESGISLAPVIGKTWSPKGKTPVVQVSGARGGVLAMSAVSPTGRIRFRLEDRKINAKVMIEFLRQIGKTHPKRKVAVVMDRAPCHMAKRLNNFIDNQKQLKVFYIPPYSPELNPDEKAWRHLKHVSLKNRAAKNKAHLSRMVVGALRQMQQNPNLVKNFFKNYLV
jgi:transposase